MRDATDAAQGAAWHQRLGDTQIFALVVLAALAIRLIYLMQLSTSPLFVDPIMDAGVHHQWATLSSEGEAWSVDRHTGDPVPYFRAPLYVWFLGAVYRLFGADAGFAPRALQSLIGALSCGLVFLLGRRLFDRGVGLLAGITCAFHWTLVYFDNELLIPVLLVFVQLGVLLLLTTAYERRRWPLWAAAGLALGVSAMARPNVLLFAPAVCVWIFVLDWREGLRGPRALLSTLAFAVAVFAPILPITLRNYSVADDLVLISSQGGVNFYIGNNPRSDGIRAVVPGTPPDWWGGFDATREMAGRSLGHEPRASEVSRYFFGRAFDFWRTDPARALSLTAHKARLFAYMAELPNNKCLYTSADLFTPISRWLFGTFHLIAPLGLLGLCLSLRDARRLFPLWGFVSIYSISVIAFFVNARFRVPIVPALSILAAYATFWLVRQARDNATRPLALGFVALLVFTQLVTYMPGAGYGAIPESRGELLWASGTRLARRGDDATALIYLDRAIEQLRGDIEQGREGSSTRLMLLAKGLAVKGDVLLRNARPEEATDAYMASLELLPERVLERVLLERRLARSASASGEAELAAEHAAAAEVLLLELGIDGPIRDTISVGEND
jgi:4-amino-4-deoxy-L-arabinose transferase-like glycosyltransferase